MEETDNKNGHKQTPGSISFKHSKGDKVITDKLLGEVLNESILNSVIEGNTLYWQAETIDLMGTQTGQINIYELAHKVKEWAKNKNFYIISYPTKSSYVSKLKGSFVESWSANTEPEAIYQAGEWILQNIARKIQ